MLSIIIEQVVLKANGQEKEINGFIVKKIPSICLRKVGSEKIKHDVAR